MFRFKPIADYQFDIGIEKPFLWGHPFTLWSNPNHTFTKPVCLIRLKLPFFDMALKLMEEGYGVLNRQGKTPQKNIKERPDQNFKFSFSHRSVFDQNSSYIIRKFVFEL